MISATVPRRRFPAAQSRVAHASCVALRLSVYKADDCISASEIATRIVAECDETKAVCHLRRCFKNILVIIMPTEPGLWHGTRVSSHITRSCLRAISIAVSLGVHRSPLFACHHYRIKTSTTHEPLPRRYLVHEDMGFESSALRYHSWSSSEHFTASSLYQRGPPSTLPPTQHSPAAYTAQ